jgi:glucose-1-phosphate thymidylyltransferase
VEPQVERASRAAVIVDAGGSGSQGPLHALTIANRPLLLHILDTLAEAGVERAVLAVDPRVEPPVRQALDGADPLPLEVTYFRRTGSDGLVGILSALGRASGDGPLLVHWACGLFKGRLTHHLEEGPVGPLDVVVLVDMPSTHSAVVELATERLAAVARGPRSGRPGGLAGLALLGSAAGRVASEIEPAHDPDLDLLAVLERMAALGGRTRAVPAGRCWRSTGAVDSALEVNRFVLEDLDPRSLDRQLDGGGVQGAVRIDPTATLVRSTVRGPVVIGPRARVYDSYVGPYTSIAEDVCIEGAEVENSILLEGSRVSHLGRRLEASVVGSGSHICRDFRLPRALRVNLGEHATVSVS